MLANIGPVAQTAPGHGLQMYRYTASEKSIASGTYIIGKGDQCLLHDGEVGACPNKPDEKPIRWKYDAKNNTLQNADSVNQCLTQSEQDCFAIGGVGVGDCASDDAKRFILTGGGIADKTCGLCYRTMTSKAGPKLLTGGTPENCDDFTETKQTFKIDWKIVGAVALGVILVAWLATSGGKKKREG